MKVQPKEHYRFWPHSHVINLTVPTRNLLPPYSTTTFVALFWLLVILTFFLFIAFNNFDYTYRWRQPQYQIFENWYSVVYDMVENFILCLQEHFRIRWCHLKLLSEVVNLTCTAVLNSGFQNKVKQNPTQSYQK